MGRVLSHVDVRVRDRHFALAFYAALFEPLGIELEVEGETWTSFVDPADPSDSWFAFTEDSKMIAGSTRIAFQAASRVDVDRVAAVLPLIGAREIEGPGEAYGPNYYAVFFEDRDGNKLEVCHVSA